MSVIQWNLRKAFVTSIVLALLAFTSPILEISAAPVPSVSFNVGRTVDLHDEHYVREGVHLAQTYLKQNLNAEVVDDLVVNVRDTSHPTKPGMVGYSGGDFIVVFTGSSGWLALAPFDRVHVVVHEYIHVYQRDMLGAAEGASPAWLIEGLAEYLSYDAVARAGLVKARAVQDFHAWVLANGPSLPHLSSFESLRAYQTAEGPIYNLSYLAVLFLVADHGTDPIGRYFVAVAAGADWRSAFASAFTMDIASFYVAFEQWRQALVAPANIPRPFRDIAESAEPAAVTIESVPEAASAGNQITLLAKTAPGTRCKFRLQTADRRPALTHRTVADATGLVFWLVTIPELALPGPASATVGCGAGQRAAVIAIEALGSQIE